MQIHVTPEYTRTRQAANGWSSSTSSHHALKIPCEPYRCETRKALPGLTTPQAQQTCARSPHAHSGFLSRECNTRAKLVGLSPTRLLKNRSRIVFARQGTPSPISQEGACERKLAVYVACSIQGVTDRSSFDQVGRCSGRDGFYWACSGRHLSASWFV